MREFLLTLIMVIVYGPSGFCQNDLDREILTQLKEHLWPKAYSDQDPHLLDKILAYEFQMIDSEGNWSNKEKEMEYVRNNPPSYDTLYFEILRLDVFENGTAIVAGKGVVLGTDSEGPYRTEYFSSNILIKRKRKWKAVASHVSGVQVNP